MATKFSPGSKAYDRDGRAYVVEVADGGTVYCTSSNGVEMEFPESTLLSAPEWTARADGRRDVSYARLKQARAFTTPSEKIDRIGAEQLLAKIDRLSPSLLDFAAFTTAKQILIDNKDDDLIAGLSIIKSRAIFDEAKPEVRASLVAGLLSNRAETMISAVKLGDNLLRAMLDKGLAAHETAFEDFQDRPRR
ncbi:MAG: hypothetical protein K2P94_02230 [Rhodospirillaceae bacterium]|nr:hypothetical protein [Rhodospirillaceae bacterium]